MSIQGSILNAIEQVARLSSLGKIAKGYQAGQEAKLKEQTLKGEELISQEEEKVEALKGEAATTQKELERVGKGKTVKGESFKSEAAQKREKTKLTNKLTKQQEAFQKAEESLKERILSIRGGKQGGRII